MKISGDLLKLKLAKMENEFLRLINLLGNPDSEETEDLKSYIDKHLVQIHRVKTLLASLENNSAAPLAYELFEDLRKLKLRSHFAVRRWKLILSNEARNRKIRERMNHVASVAA